MSANPPSPAGAGGEIIHSSQSPKDPILICVLNLLVLGGVGYIIMGQKMKGIIAIVAWLILLVPPSCGTLSGVVAVVAATDGYLQAQQLQQGKPIGQWTWFQNHK
jgi:hypothetical protein